MCILLDDEERRELLDYPWFDKSNDEYYDIDELLRAQLKKVLERWGKEPILHVVGENGEAYDKSSVDEFWQALKKEVNRNTPQTSSRTE